MIHEVLLTVFPKINSNKEIPIWFRFNKETHYILFINEKLYAYIYSKTSSIYEISKQTIQVEMRNSFMLIFVNHITKLIIFSVNITSPCYNISICLNVFVISSYGYLNYED